MDTNSANYLTELHQLINQYFNLAEIQMLCLDLHVDYESVAGEEKPSRIRELLLALGRNGRLPELIILAQRQRPLVEWPPVPDDFELPESLVGETAVTANQYHVYGDVVHGDKIGGDKVAGDKIIYEAGATAVYQGLSVEEVVTLVVELKNQDQPIVWNGRTPYLGLTSFQESDAEFFFGRESLVDDLLERVQQANFIVIAGPSGSGKSSVARAGLFHALRSGRLTKSDSWLLTTMQPKGDPIDQLALALERATKSTQVGDAIRADGASNPALLQRQIEMHLADDSRQRCVLLVDQFEETFTQTKDEVMHTAFINLLTTAAQAKGKRTIIVLSLRSDFISACAPYETLNDLLGKQFRQIGMMSPRDLAKAITLPALEVGTKIDPALVSRIITDMKGEPGALPLMSFALRDLFEAEKTIKGQPMELTLARYLERGGIESALERHANKVFDGFSVKQKVLARGIFSKLTEVGQGHVDTRRTAAFQDLIPAGIEPEAVTAVVTTLAAEGVRLITTDAEVVDEETTQKNRINATVTLAHEKLIDAWP